MSWLCHQAWNVLKAWNSSSTPHELEVVQAWSFQMPTCFTGSRLLHKYGLLCFVLLNMNMFLALKKHTLDCATAPLLSQTSDLSISLLPA